MSGHPSSLDAQKSAALAAAVGLDDDTDLEALKTAPIYCVICKDDRPRDSVMSTPRGGSMCRSHRGTPEGRRVLAGKDL